MTSKMSWFLKSLVCSVCSEQETCFSGGFMLHVFLDTVLLGPTLPEPRQEASAAEKAREAAPKSISSSTVGNVSHMDWASVMWETSQTESIIKHLPVV